MLRGLGDALKEADALTLGNALTRYSIEITPHKKSASNEFRRINDWKLHPLAFLPLPSMRGKQLAEYQDSRTAGSIGANTVLLELALISHLDEVARKDWGLKHLCNPAKLVRKPKLAGGRTRRLQSSEEDQQDLRAVRFVPFDNRPMVLTRRTGASHS
ncbi:hypothetical protein [Collimonas silvisoli]|uniref:hypothetical protein n=1 Tax=Collimonas silvisoli TaxID=2825884 RepID=UPI001B8BC6AC|nr:hypothetical protein [Collimonas silvisoli]